MIYEVENNKPLVLIFLLVFKLLFKRFCHSFYFDHPELYVKTKKNLFIYYLCFYLCLKTSKLGLPRFQGLLPRFKMYLHNKSSYSLHVYFNSLVFDLLTSFSYFYMTFVTFWKFSMVFPLW